MMNGKNSVQDTLQETIDSFLNMASSQQNPLVRAKLEKFGKRAGKALLIAVGIGYAAWEIWKLFNALLRHLRRCRRP